MSMVTIANKAIESTALKPYLVFGGKNTIIITGVLPVVYAVPTVIGTYAPEDLSHSAFLVGSKTVNTAIPPLPDNTQMYTGSANRGDFGGAFFNNATGVTGAFSVTYRVSVPLPIKTGTKIKNANIKWGGEASTASFILSGGSLVATGVAIVATLKVINTNGTETTIGSDTMTFGNLNAGATIYRPKNSFNILGTEHVAVDNDFLCIEYTISGNITSHPGNSYINITLSNGANYIQHTNYLQVSTLTLSS